VPGTSLPNFLSPVSHSFPGGGSVGKGDRLFLSFFAVFPHVLRTSVFCQFQRPCSFLFYLPPFRGGCVQSYFSGSSRRGRVLFLSPGFLRFSRYLCIFSLNLRGPLDSLVLLGPLIETYVSLSLSSSVCCVYFPSSSLNPFLHSDDLFPFGSPDKITPPFNSLTGVGDPLPKDPLPPLLKRKHHSCTPAPTCFSL